MKLFFKVIAGDREHFDLLLCPESEAEYVTEAESFQAWKTLFDLLSYDLHAVRQDMADKPNALTIVPGPFYSLQGADGEIWFTSPENWDFWESRAAYDKEMDGGHTEAEQHVQLREAIDVLTELAEKEDKHWHMVGVLSSLYTRLTGDPVER